MTITVTPLSAESLGLAVVEKRPDGFVVRELFEGMGTYSFDYIVMSVKRGMEDWEVRRQAYNYRRPLSDAGAAFKYVEQNEMEVSE